MPENQPEKAIPNVIGRLDPVIDAIRAEDWISADDLCQSELVRRGIDIVNMEAELKRKQAEYEDVKQFSIAIYDLSSREKILAEARK